MSGRNEHADSGWKSVWEARRLAPSGGSMLSRLLVADGYDSGFAKFDEMSWIDFVGRRATDLGVESGMSVFEVGCGAGAFLYELRRAGCVVSGIDYSESLVDIARSVMPDSDFEVREAAQLEDRPPADVVLACSVFAYFPSLEYASRVIERMVAKADRAVAILDVPDRALEQAARAYRRGVSGGDENYAARYEGLEHCYYDRDWLTEALRGLRLTGVHVADQDLTHDGNAPFRFNAWGFKGP